MCGYNSLWQADFRRTDEDKWMVSYLDDHSRFIPGSRIHHNVTTEHAIRLLEESIKQYGKPDRIFTDTGRQFHPARAAISEFTEWCSGNGSSIMIKSSEVTSLSTF